MVEALSGTLASQLSAIDKLKEFFFTANLLFSLAMIVFVVFFCIRAVANTKVSFFLLSVSVFLFAVYSFFTENEVYQMFVTHLMNRFEGQVGMMLCILSVTFLFLGLRDEDTTDEYVHSRFYWWLVVISMYVGLFSISLSMKAEELLSMLGV